MKSYNKFYILMPFLLAIIFFPTIVQSPTYWYEIPLIPGLEEKSKIIFLHVPMAWLAVIGFVQCLIYSIKFLRTNDLSFDLKAEVALELGIVFCILATVTGSIWAKFTWGSFWNWDPRETSIFILLLIYGAMLVLRGAIAEPEKKAKLSAVYMILSFISVPFFIFIMPRIMVGLHPGSADDNSAGPVINFHMDLKMLVIFFISLIVFSLLYANLWKTEIKIKELNKKSLKILLKKTEN